MDMHFVVPPTLVYTSLFLAMASAVIHIHGWSTVMCQIAVSILANPAEELALQRTGLNALVRTNVYIRTKLMMASLIVQVMISSKL